MDHISSAPNLGLPPTLSTSSDTLRLQHLYTLAFADRIRLMQQQQQPFSPFPPMLGPHFVPRFAPPADLAMFPMAKLDPRLFRIPFPEEPKPQHSYIGLIAMAILRAEGKKLVLADIYQYILDNYPYFRHRGPGWRNSIRHNLSLNDCFIKAGRASNGKGHFWAVHPACQEDFLKGDFSRRKAQRKVRRYLGMNVGLDEEDTPPSSPAPAELADTIKFEDQAVDPVSVKFEPSAYTHYVIPASPARESASPTRESASPIRTPAFPTTPQFQQSFKRSFSFGIDSLLQREEKKPKLFTDNQ